MYVKRVGLIQKMRNISEQLTGYRFVIERNVLTQSSICLIEEEQDTTLGNYLKIHLKYSFYSEKSMHET